MSDEYCVEVDEKGVPFVQHGKYQLRLDLEDLDGEYKERAIRELRETDENLRNGINKLRSFIAEETELHVPIEDEDFLLKFLRPCKHYPESAFRLMKKFYKFKAKHPKYGLNLTPQRVRTVFDQEVFTFLPTRSPSGARLMVINVGTKWNPKHVKLDDMFRGIMVAIEIAMLEPKTQVGGAHVILNFQGLSFNHIYQFNPSTAKLILDWVQECTPVRLKGIHIINQPGVFTLLFAIFKPFLGEKLKKRLFFYGTNLKEMCDKISADVLPEYLGGTADLPDVPGKTFSDTLFYYEDDFKTYNSYGYQVEPTK